MSLSGVVTVAVAALACILLCEASIGNLLKRNQLIFQAVNADQGEITDCGDHKTMSTFAFNWSPKDVKFGDTLTMNADFTSAMPFSTGKACFKIWVAGIPDPILSDCQAVTCDDLLKALSQIGFKIACPLTKGAKYDLKDYKVKVLPKIPIPEGSYTLSANVTTESGVPYMCAKGSVTVKG